MDTKKQNKNPSSTQKNQPQKQNPSTSKQAPSK